MKYLRLLCLLFCLGLLHPLPTSQAAFNAEVIFTLYQGDGPRTEFWISEVRNTRQARKIYTHPEDVHNLAAQPDGDLIVFVSDPPVHFFAGDAYLIDRRRLREGARDLTKLRFDFVVDVDISKNGDVVFTNSPTALHEEEPKYGVHLIRSQELKKATPKAELLFEEEEIWHVRWSPDGRHITFESWNKVWIHDVKTGSSSQVEIGHTPVFSPDGNRLAYTHKVLGQKVAISVISIFPHRQHLKTIVLNEDGYVDNLDWTPDGESLVYTVHSAPRRTYVVPLDGSPREEILMFGKGGVQALDWTRTAYAVEPTQKLTTLWGALKTHNTPHR